VATTSGIQNFTNKAIALGSNTITGTSAQLATAISDETGSGALVFATAPTITSPTFTETVTLPSTVTGSGALNITAGGTSQSVTITPTGFGQVLLRSATGVAEVGVSNNASFLRSVEAEGEVGIVSVRPERLMLVQASYNSLADSNLSNSAILLDEEGWRLSIFTHPDNMEEETYYLEATRSGTVGGPLTTASYEDGLAGKIAVTNADGNVNDLIDGSKMVSAAATGTAAEVESVVIPLAVPAWATDTQELRVGDDTTLGGKQIHKIGGYTYTPDTGSGDGQIDFTIPSSSVGAQNSVTPYGFFSDGMSTFHEIKSSMIGAVPGTSLQITSQDDLQITSQQSVDLIADAIYLSSASGTAKVDAGLSLNVGGNPTTEAAGLKLGPDVAIYRSAANTLASTDLVRFTNTTVSTSTSTGALVIGGGLGVGGRITASSVSANIVTTINAQTGTTYTLTSTDAGRLVTLTNTDPITVEVPPDATTIDIGSSVEIAQMGAGQVTLAPGSGVTLVSFGNALTTSGLGATAVLTKTAADTWLVRGNLIP